MKQNNKKISASILVIGNEILSGRTQDLNVAFISNWLNEKCGINLKEVRIIPDVEKLIVSHVLELSENFDYVFTTGGIGPTHDDITSKSISNAFKVKYEYNKKAFNILKKYYGIAKFNDGRKKMAKMPKGSLLINNPSSAAPGFKIKNVLCLPGVPSILKSMINNCRKYLVKGPKILTNSINLYTVESNIAKSLSKIQKTHFKYVEIGSYPFFRLGRIGVSVVLSSSKKSKLKECSKDIMSLVYKKKIKLFK
ncbi:molybdopterin-binding protein [Pelagibacteraceae bacterium]|nr:molybdopterin-binding protein [Pelagibacteraceae bacterium]